jgi:hypothetical protein
MNNIKYFVVALFFLLGCTSCTDKKNSADKKSAVQMPTRLGQYKTEELSPILTMLENAKIIGLSEANHYMAEPLNFRNDLIKFLVKEKRIDVIALESGIIESRKLHDYVNGQSGNIDSVLFNGISWTFDKLPQNKELIVWLRNYNQDSSNSHKVKLYGFDIPGSPLNPFANRKMNTSITSALAYLKTVDPKNWVKLNKRLNPVMGYIHINISKPNVKQYFHLNKVGRNELSSITNELIKLFETKQLDYQKHSSKEDYDWAYLAARSAKDIDNWLQTIPLSFKPSTEVKETVFSNFFWKLHGKRDLTMANNVDWIKAREKNANILLFGHINHLSKSSQTLVLPDSSQLVKDKQLGQYLDSTYQDSYKVIGNFMFKANRSNGITKKNDDSFENYLMQMDSTNYYHLVSKRDQEWMDKEWKIGEAFLDATTYMNPFTGVDLILFNPTQTEVVLD